MDFKESFESFLRTHQWHNKLLDPITIYLDSSQNDTNVDNLLMSVTKIVETSLRENIQRKLSSKDKSPEVGIRLLDSAVHCHFIKSKDEPLYSLLFWILKEPRNLHHHEFQYHPVKSLQLFILQADHAIFEMEKIWQSQYRGEFKVEVHEEEKTIEVYEAKVYNFENEDITEDIKLDANFTFSNGKTGAIKLDSNGGGYKHGKYDYRGNAAGTLRIGLAGVTYDNTFVTQSGSTAFLVSNYQKCPKCGKVVQSQDWRCSFCGERFFIY
ncbi:MAG: zinc ribbon domain-containing protein [Candidatus Helarchaeota archaeon]